MTSSGLLDQCMVLGPIRQSQQSMPSFWRWFSTQVRLSNTTLIYSQSCHDQRFRRRHKPRLMLSLVRIDFPHGRTGPTCHMLALSSPRSCDGIASHHWASAFFKRNDVTDIVLGIPHVPTEDGYIGGHFVPKGALIIANLWYVRHDLKSCRLFLISHRRAMLHDPALYPRPFEFDPERHIPGPGREVQYDPRKICFGYARRVCPGLALADASLFSCVVLSLAAFNIEKALDVNGIPIIPVHENTNGTIRYELYSNFTNPMIMMHFLSFPKTYKCSIKPRSSKILSLL